MKRVLIVDDEKRIRSVYGNMLTGEGFEILEADNAVAANEILRENKIDIMLLDINMPYLDGSMFYEVVRSFHKDVPVIVASVYPIDDQVNLVENAMDYYDKSESLSTLLEKIRKVLA